MKKFKPELRSLAAGSLPHVNHEAACQLMLDTLDIPTWPQLPQRSFLENMYVQFSQRFPGIVITEEQIYVDRDRDLDPELEQLYIAYLTNDLQFAAIDRQYAAGLYCFLESSQGHAPAVKGQITGPLSWSLMVVDQNREPILHDDVLVEAASKHLRLKASWMEQELRKIAPHTILFVDEPYLSSFDSNFVSLTSAQAVALLEEVLAGIEGLKGILCCGCTDFSVLLSTSVDVLCLDAYDYPHALAQQPEQVEPFLERDGIIAWGIVPADDRVFEETVDSLMERFYGALEPLTALGIQQDDLLESALIMPSCGCGSLALATAEQVLKLTAELSQALQERYA